MVIIGPIDTLVFCTVPWDWFVNQSTKLWLDSNELTDLNHMDVALDVNHSRYPIIEETEKQKQKRQINDFTNLIKTNKEFQSLFIQMGIEFTKRKEIEAAEHAITNGNIISHHIISHHIISYHIISHHIISHHITSYHIISHHIISHHIISHHII